MTPEDIRIELFKRRKQITMAAIARDLGCTPTAVGRVISGQTVSRRIMEAVAEAIGRDKEQVFPEYFIKPQHQQLHERGL